MKGYLLTVAGAVLLSALLSILMPEGKMGKFVKGIARLFVFSALTAPFFTYFAKGDFGFFSEPIAEDKDYLVRCAELLSEEDERAIVDRLTEEFSVEAEAEVLRSADAGFPREKISVKILRDGINGQEEHIDMINRIRADLEEEFGCKNTEVVWQGTSKSS